MSQKWNLQDIVPPNKQRSRTTASPASRRPVARDIRTHATPPVYEPPTTLHEDQISYQNTQSPIDTTVARLEITDGRLSRIRVALFSAIALAIIGFIGFSATIILNGAEVVVHPKVFSTMVQAEYEAKIKPEVAELGYELLSLEATREQQIPATGNEQVAEKATGKILIYNTADTQRFIQNTRFESPEGLIYRITEAVVIPGATKDAAGTVKPGTLTTTVVADGAGDAYNLVNGRLTVPGLKGTDQYTKVYAEVTEGGIVGGFEGMKMIINPEELAVARQKLHTELRDTLRAQIEEKRPNGYILYTDAIRYTYESLPATGAGESAAVIKEQARLYVPLFNESKFAQFLARSTNASYAGEPVRIQDPYAMTFSYKYDPLEDISQKESLRFSLSGPTTIVSVFDQKSFKKDILGISTSDDTLTEILRSKYPSIQKASASVRPIWKRSLPKEEEKIIIKEVIGG